MRRKRRQRLRGSAQRQLAHVRAQTAGDGYRYTVLDLFFGFMIFLVLMGFGAAFLGTVNHWMHVQYAGLAIVLAISWLAVMACGVGGSINVNCERIDRDTRPWRFWFEFSLFAIGTTGGLCLVIYLWMTEAGWLPRL